MIRGRQFIGDLRTTPVFTGVVWCMIYWEENGGKMRIGVDIDGVLELSAGVYAGIRGEVLFREGFAGADGYYGA